MKYVNLCIPEEVDETGLTEMQIKEKGREQFGRRLIEAILNDYKNHVTHTEIVGNEVIRTVDFKEFTKLINQMSWSIQAEPELTWAQEVEKDAREYIKENLIDATIASIIAHEGTKSVFNWHRNHSNTWYEITRPQLQPNEAISLITNLHESEETDKGLIGDGELEDQLCNKAAYTYENALYSEIESQLSDIDSSIDIDEIELNTMNEILTRADDIDMERDGIDLSNEDAMLDWAKENKESWNETLEKNVRVAINELLA